MTWVRPASVPLGQVWSRFKGREREGKPALNYQVRDLDTKNRNQYLELMLETFLRDEPLCHVLDIKSDPPSMKSILANWNGYLDQKVSLACYTEDASGNPDELVAFNFVVVRTVGDEEETFEHVEGEPWKKLANTLTTAEKLVNIFEHYGVDTYMSTSGMTVLPGHRGQNIGARIMEARKHLCQSLGINVISTVFTAITSQVLAAKSGYEELAMLQYKDVADLKGLHDELARLNSPTAKVMGIKFNF